MLPGADIQFSNGNIDSVVASEDGLFGLLASGVAVAGKFELDTSYLLKGMTGVAALGILPNLDNHKLYTTLSEFYQEAGEGTELYLHVFSKDTKVSDWFTADGVTGMVPAGKLLNVANGAINGLFTCYDPTDEITIENGMDSDVVLAKQKAQLFAENYIESKSAPFFVLLEAYGFTGVHTDLPNLELEDNNRVGIVVGSGQKRSANPASNGSVNHIVMGRLAAIPVSSNPGKVKDGSLELLTAYVVDTAVEEYDVEALHDKGYITLRTHVGKAGYYIADDPLATNPDDDYRYISRRRVIDKAYRIAHSIATNEINEDFDLQNDGTIDPFYAKTVEGLVEEAIFNQMTTNSELSRDRTDNNDLGVKAFFDTTVNVAATSTTKMILEVRPKGTNRWFQISLGFNVNLNN